MGTRKAESTPDVSSHRWSCQRGIGSATRGRARPAQTPDHYCTRRERQAENGGDYGGNPRRRGTKAKRQKETINLAPTRDATTFSFYPMLWSPVKCSGTPRGQGSPGDFHPGLLNQCIDRPGNIPALSLI